MNQLDGFTTVEPCCCHEKSDQEEQEKSGWGQLENELSLHMVPLVTDEYAHVRVDQIFVHGFWKWISCVRFVQYEVIVTLESLFSYIISDL